MSIPLKANMNSAFYSSRIQFTYNWIIEDFQNRKEKTGEFLWSDLIEIHEPDGRITKWKFAFFPKGEKQENLENANLEEMPLFIFTSLNHFDIKISFTCSILDASTGAKKKRFSFKDKLFTRPSPYIGYAFCKQAEIRNNPQWFVDGNLTIVCDIDFMSEKTISSPNKANLSKRIQKQLCEDYSKMFLDETNSDLEVICGKKTFNCHRNILSARSPVFKAMLQADMEEKRLGQVMMKDFSPRVTEDMLMFIYSSKLGPFSKAMHLNEDDLNHVVDLLKAADLYQLDLLKASCEETLCRGLNFKKCLFSLIIGDIYRAEELKKSSMKMFLDYMDIVLAQCPGDWEIVVKEHPDLTIEITTEIAKRQCNA